jgi:hypothetical protein
MFIIFLQNHLDNMRSTKVRAVHLKSCSLGAKALVFYLKGIISVKYTATSISACFILCNKI